MVHFAYYGDNWEAQKAELGTESAEEQYQRLTDMVVDLTGHEGIQNPDGSLTPRVERESRFRTAIKNINAELKLGYDEKDEEILTMLYVALSEVPRFGENEHIAPEHAENTGTHSIHTPLRTNMLIRKGMERLGVEEDTKETVVMRQLAGMLVMPHDAGEALGEPGSLAQESKYDGFKKDQAKVEGLVTNSILRLAADAVESGDKSIFYDRLDEIKMHDISDDAKEQTPEAFMRIVRERLGIPPELGPEAEGRVAVFNDFWQMQEHPGHVPNRFQGDEQLNAEFLSQLSGLSEHMQGEGHFLHFMQREDDPNSPEVSWSRVRSKRQLGNLKYCEGELGDLFAAAKTDLEKAIAIEAKHEVYAKSIEFLELGAAAVDRTQNNVHELDAGHPDRNQEIDLLVQQSKLEGQQRALRGEDDQIRDIETRERLVAMYEWAKEKDDFVPEPGQILIVDPPADYRAQAQDRSAVERYASGPRGASAALGG